MKNKFVSVIVKIIIIIIIAGIAIFAGFIYSKAQGNEDISQSQKVEKEIHYLDTQITSLINRLNRHTT